MPLRPSQLRDNHRQQAVKQLLRAAVALEESGAEACAVALICTGLALLEIAKLDGTNEGCDRAIAWIKDQQSCRSEG